MQKQIRLSEKERPTDVQALVGTYHKRLFNSLIDAEKRGELGQTLLFLGKSGTGKTTIAKMLIAHLQGKLGSLEQGFHYEELNCGTDNGISAVRDLVTRLNQPSLIRNNYRIVLLNELQALTKSAQSGLLDTLETLSDGVLIIATAMQEDKFIDAFVDRFSVYRLPVPSKSELTEWIVDISTKNNIKINNTIIEELIQTSNGSLRKILNGLEKVQNGTFIPGPSFVEDKRNNPLFASVFFGKGALNIVELAQQINESENFLAIKYSLLNYAFSSITKNRNIRESALVIKHLSSDIEETHQAQLLMKLYKLTRELYGN